MSDFPSRKVFPNTATVGDNGHLMLGGCDVADLVAEYGTPLYVYDEETLRGIQAVSAARVHRLCRQLLEGQRLGLAAVGPVRRLRLGPGALVL